MRLVAGVIERLRIAMRAKVLIESREDNNNALSLDNRRVSLLSRSTFN